MAERERRRADRRAVIAGIVGFLVATPVTFGALVVIRALVLPVMRQLVGGALVPGHLTLVAFALAVGGVAGWGRMRGQRLYVTGSGVALTDALAAARRRAAEEQSRRAAGGLTVNRWDPGLLAGGDLHEVEEVTP